MTGARWERLCRGTVVKWKGDPTLGLVVEMSRKSSVIRVMWEGNLGDGTPWKDSYDISFAPSLRVVAKP